MVKYYIVSNASKLSAGFINLKSSSLVDGTKTLPSRQTIFSLSDVWELKKIRKKWKLNGSGTVIAIIDTDFNRICPSFSKKESCHFVDCLSDNRPNVSTQHGTVCAAVAAGHSYSISLSQKYPSGVAPKAALIVYRVSDGNGYCSAPILQALEEIIKNLKKTPVDVVSMSFSFKGSDEDEKKLSKFIKELSDSGVILVAAAGNCGKLQARAKLPASLPHVISCGSLNKEGPSGFSPSSGLTDVFVPGENIPVPPNVKGTSEAIRDVEVVKGTSVATAAVAGLVALLKQCVTNSFSDEPDLIKRITEPQVLRCIFRHHMITEIYDEGILVDKVFDPLGFFEQVNKCQGVAWLKGILLAKLEPIRTSGKIEQSIEGTEQNSDYKVF